MADPMRIQALLEAGMTEVKILMKYETENGTRLDRAGKKIPPQFIQSVNVRHKDKEVLSAQFGATAPKDPVVSFKFKGGARGEKIVATWVDSKGDKRTDEALIS